MMACGGKLQLVETCKTKRMVWHKGKHSNQIFNQAATALAIDAMQCRANLKLCGFFTVPTQNKNLALNG